MNRIWHSNTHSQSDVVPVNQWLISTHSKLSIYLGMFVKQPKEREISEKIKEKST